MENNIEGLEDEVYIYSEQVRDVLTDPPKLIFRIGNTIMFCFVALLLVITWFIKYPDIVQAEATITTKTPPQKEFASVAAKIDSIYVSQAETVQKNDILAVLENTANTDDLLYLKSIVDTIDLKNNPLSFPIDNMPLLSLGEVEQSFALFENSHFQYKLNEQLKPFSNDALANKISIAELQSRLRSIKSQLALNKSELNYKEKELQRNNTLYDKGVISLQELENKKMEVLVARQNHESLDASIYQLREAIGNANRNKKGTEIIKTREEIQLFKSLVQSFNQLKNAIKDWEKTYVLKSKIIGRVSFLNYWDENQTVRLGDLVFTIIPINESNYIAKLKTPAHNSGKIKIHQSVNFSLYNYAETEFGFLRGKVEKVSLTPDENGFYTVDVSLPKKLITSYNKEIEFKQEMGASAEIITEDLRLIERIFYQFKNFFQ